MKVTWSWLAGACLLAAGNPGWADNPRVTASLRNATPVEAVAALSLASKVPIRVFTEAEGIPGAPPPVRGTFDWKNTPFSTALRQLCNKYSLHPGRTMGGGYQLHPLFQAVPPPAGAGKRVGLVERGDFSMHVAATRIGINRMVRFDGGDDMEDSHLAVEFVGRVKDGDADSIAGLRNVVATDDLGHKLVASIGEADRNVFSPAYPDEWASHLIFQAPPRARKLVSIRGEVTHYRVHKTLRFQVALPAPGKSAMHEAEDVMVKVVSFDPDPKRKPEDQDEDGPPVGAVLKVQVASRTEELVAPFEDPSSIAPILMDELGNTHEPILFNANHQGPQGMLEMECAYPRLKAKWTKALFCVVRRSQPEKLLSFEVRDVPLPAEKPFVPQRIVTSTDVEPDTGISSDHPFFQRDGGTLTQKVATGKAIGEGILAVGLSPQRGTEWGPIRWVNVPIGEGGIARLPSLKPGKYRVRRSYRPAEGQPLPANGKWEGAEVVVQVTAGKETAAVPLQWKPAATPRVGAPAETTKGRKGESGKGK